MFHFPSSTPIMAIHSPPGHYPKDSEVTPFGHPRINAHLTTPRGLTQPNTSFIGSSCPRHPPCALQHTQQAKKSQQKNCNHKRCSRPLSSSHTPQPTQHKPHNQHTITWPPGRPNTTPPQTSPTRATPAAPRCHARHPTACQQPSYETNNRGNHHTQQSTTQENKPHPSHHTR